MFILSLCGHPIHMATSGNVLKQHMGSREPRKSMGPLWGTGVVFKGKLGGAGQTWALQAVWVGLGDGSWLCGYTAQQRKGSRVRL